MKSVVQIAVIAPSRPAEFFDVLWEGIWSASLDLACFGVRVDPFRTDGHDTDQQLEILSGLLKSRYSAIAMVPADARRLDDLIGLHKQNGTPVVTFNTDAPSSSRFSFVGPDARQGGVLAGEILGKLMGPAGTFVSFSGPLDGRHFGERYEGMRDELRRQAPLLTEVACHCGLDNLDIAAADLFSQFPDLSGVYVGFSRVFQVGAVLERIGLRVPCVGFDNTEAVVPLLQGGWVSAVIEESAYLQGYIGLQRAYEATLTSIGERPDWVRVPSTVVLRSNSLNSVRSESLNAEFELLIRRRTAKVRSYQEQLEDANARLLQLAETDALTGLLNRRKFEEIVDAHVRKEGTEPSVMAMLMVDLDSFKAYNDSHGHPVGDEALRTVAGVLAKCSRATDYCARLGGDEFCLLLPGAGMDYAGEVKARILESIERVRIAPQTLNLRVSLSIGIACVPESAVTVEDLIVAADRAMYLEKRKARERIANYELAGGV